MSRKQSKIRTRSYIPLTPDGDEVICLSDLSDSQKNCVGAILQTKFLNSFYAGKHQFWTEDTPTIEDVFPALLFSRSNDPSAEM